MTTTILTGATGVLGRRVLERAAAKGLDVHPLNTDLRDAAATHAAIEAAGRIDAVLHLAAIVPIDRTTAEPRQTYDVNCGGTLNLLEAIRQSGNKPWFFYASTAHVYAPAGHPHDEASPIAPRNFYATTKYSAELIANHYASNDHVDLCIGRIFSLYDEWQTGSFLYPAIRTRIQQNRDGHPINVRDGNAVRDFSSGSELARYILDLAACRATGVVNIATGKPSAVIDKLREWFGDTATFETTSEPSSAAIVADISRLKSLINV